MSTSPRHLPSRPGRRDVLTLVGLGALSFVPVVAGATRLVGLARDVPTMPGHDRFAPAPTAVVLHIVAVTIFALGGALAIVPGVRRRSPRAHRVLGALVAPAGVVTALTGIWMAIRQAPAPFDGVALTALRVVVGTAILAFIARGAFAALVRCDFAAHGAWMLRAYALAMGAGTQLFTLMPLMLFERLHTETTHAVMMAAAWVMNAAFAEWVIARDGRRSPRSAARGTASASSASGAASLVPPP